MARRNILWDTLTFDTTIRDYKAGSLNVNGEPLRIVGGDFIMALDDDLAVGCAARGRSEDRSLGELVTLDAFVLGLLVGNIPGKRWLICI